MRCCNRRFLQHICFTLLFAAAGANPAFATLPKPTFHIGLDAAAAAASTNQSLVMLVFSATWCVPCKLFQKNTLESADFLDHAGALQITDIDIDADEKTARAFGIEAVPTLILMTPDKKIIERQTGFIEAGALVEWIKSGRLQAARGEWEGNAPGSRLESFLAKAASDSLDAEDIERLILTLDEPDPAQRAQSEKLILALRERAVPPLIDALTNAYLGIRIEAAQLLHKMAPDAPALDPWQSPNELKDVVAAVQKWWEHAGSLPKTPARAALDPSMKASMESRIADLRGDDAVKRTDAMSELVAVGEPALPLVREAIARAGRLGDVRFVALLEDVRWGILIPNELEQRARNVRAALARGSSAERQAAAERLGSTGHAGIEALTELVNDSDSLVVESAVRSLSKIGGADTIAAMSGLLRAGDSNLRMTAAQGLGHTKKAEANAPLLAALDDPDEVVACTALSALREINEGERFNPNVKATPPELAPAIKKAMADTRWRVRAAAAEAAGKLHLSDLAAALNGLLADSDGFVVQSALQALSEISATPSVGDLSGLVKRLPSLRGEAVQMILQSSSDEADATVTNLYLSGSADERLKILQALTGGRLHSPVNASSNLWRVLLSHAISESDFRLRRTAAEVMINAPALVAANLILPLLADGDSPTRVFAAEEALNLLTSKDGSANFAVQLGLSSPSTHNETNVWAVRSELMRSWHEQLVRPPEITTNFPFAVAIYVTGDLTNGVPRLVSDFARFQNNDLSKSSGETDAIGALMKWLPWPEGREILDKIAASPSAYVVAVRNSDRLRTNAADYLRDPARFAAALENAPMDVVKVALSTLVQMDYDLSQWRLAANIPSARAVARRLVDSTNAAWRTAGLFALGVNNAGKNENLFDAAIKDGDPWVRRAGIQGLAKVIKDRAELEQRIAPLLAETNQVVAGIAAEALLEPEVRSSAHLTSTETFEYEGVGSSSFGIITAQEGRPLAALEGKPAFLDAARRHFDQADKGSAPTYMLLLAQYGQFDALDRLIASSPGNETSHEDNNDCVLTGIALSRDVKYVPYLLNMARASPDARQLQAILKAARGMTGREARQLRVEVNKAIRQAGGNGLVY